MDKNFDLNKYPGLSSIEAAQILEVNGYNELPSQRNHSNFTLLYNILTEPMLILLLICGIIYCFMGEAKDA